MAKNITLEENEDDSPIKDEEEEDDGEGDQELISMLENDVKEYATPQFDALANDISKIEPKIDRKSYMVERLSHIFDNDGELRVQIQNFITEN